MWYWLAIKVAAVLKQGLFMRVRTLSFMQEAKGVQTLWLHSLIEYAAACVLPFPLISGKNTHPLYTYIWSCRTVQAKYCTGIDSPRATL